MKTLSELPKQNLVDDELALFGGSPLIESSLPAYNPINHEDLEEASRVLKSGKLSGFVATPGESFLGGHEVLALEAMFTKRFKIKYAISMNSATSCLHAALLSIGIKPNDEVIVAPYSMSASATSIAMCGANPVFVDVNADSFCIEPENILRAITTKTKAVLVVNLFGRPAELSKIKAICDENNIFLIEDSAQAPGAEIDGLLAGTVGQIGIFSLNRHKTIQCGEGGVCVTDDARLAKRLRLIRNHSEAVIPEMKKTEYHEEDIGLLGFNYRLTELQAAVAKGQVCRLHELNEPRIRLAKHLMGILQDCDFLHVSPIPSNIKHVFYLFPFHFLKEKAGFDRDLFLKVMNAEGLPVANYARPLYRLPIFRSIFGNNSSMNTNNFPITERLWSETMCVTSICRPPLDEKHIDLFGLALKKIKINMKRLRST